MLAHLRTPTGRYPELNSKPFPADGSPLTADAGMYTVQLIPTIDGGYVLRVKAGTHDYTELADNFTDERVARDTARAVTTALRAGISIWQVIQDRLNGRAAVTEAEQFLSYAAQAMTARDPEQVAAEINAEWDARHAQTTRAHNQLVSDVQQLRDTDGWRQAREQARKAANTGLARFQGGKANTRPAPTGKNAELNDVQLRALTLRNPAGEIRVQPGVAKTTLEALAARGYGRLVCGGPGRRPYEIAKLALYPAVINQLNTQQEAA